MHIQHSKGSSLVLYVHSRFSVGSLPRDLEANLTLPTAAWHSTKSSGHLCDVNILQAKE